MTRTKSKPKAITRARPKTTKPKSSRRPVPVGAASGAPPRTRAGTKNAQVVAMLQDRAGTTIADIMTATGWQQHSVRGFLAGVIRKVESFWDIRTKTPQRVPPPGPEQALRIHQNGSFFAPQQSRSAIESGYGCCLGLVGATLGSERVGRLSLGFLTGAAINPSRIACFRAILRARRMASDFSRAAFSEGFS